MYVHQVFVLTSQKKKITFWTIVEGEKHTLNRIVNFFPRVGVEEIGIHKSR
jgi:hypothetical protein